MTGGFDQFGHVGQLDQIMRRAVSFANFVQHVAQQRGTDPAGGAEPAAFMGEELGEIAGDFQHIAGMIEGNEGAAGGEVFESQLAVKFFLGNEGTGRAANLDTEGLFGSAILENFGDRRTEGVFIDAGTDAVSGDAQHLGAGGFAGAFGGEPGTAVEGDPRRRREGLHIIDDRRLPQIPMRDGIGRTVAGIAALALQRFDQGGFLAADIGARSQVDADVEIEPGLAQDGLAEQTLLTALFEHALQRLI